MERGGTPRIPQRLYDGYVFDLAGTICLWEVLPDDLCADPGWKGG